ncbi:hypothetical protein [Brevundimonas sp.]|uniref:hypothetical protein n=1 Tax=Brevundimonas sp. TaxID=1871086 RepID=UPI003AF7B18F
MRGLFLFLLALASLSGGPAAAQQAALPPRTEVISVSPPDGWVMSVWQGGTVELGEFTPPGQTGPAYIDLVGYSVFPLIEALPSDMAGLRAYEIKAAEGCRISRYAERAAPEGWLYLARICVGRPGHDADQVEIEFAATTITDQGIYRIWRAHRGPSAEFGIRAERLSQADFESLADDWAQRLAPDIERREICDMVRPEECKFVAAPLPADLAMTVDGQPHPLIAVAFSGLDTLPRQEFMRALDVPADYVGPAQVVAILTAGSFDWDDPTTVTALLRQLSLGKAAEGALLYLIPSPQQTAIESGLERVMVIGQTRRLWQAGRPVSDIQVWIP